jgi:hypothetical protein
MKGIVNRSRACNFDAIGEISMPTSGSSDRLQQELKEVTAVCDHYRHQLDKLYEQMVVFHEDDSLTLTLDPLSVRSQVRILTPKGIWVFSDLTRKEAELIWRQVWGLTKLTT